MIVVADDDSSVLQEFASCKIAEQVDCPHCERGSGTRKLFLCRDPVRPFPEVWVRLKDFV